MSSRSLTVLLSAEGPHLGHLICKSCGDVIDTLPTSGYKKLYSTCDNEDCKLDSRFSYDD
ncbi:GapA-binding peptide SR1P [Paenibacillus sp. GCM10023252]|uniref:GapA-binding peptide SR1P n=1 Tax=Paenibacillus sp. GCM10023252 TaxID=3252649 RepID=UPI00360B0147